jgi:epsin
MVTPYFFFLSFFFLNIFLIVRQKAKDVTNLLMDDNRLREERRQRQGMRERMAHVGDYLNETVRQIDGGQGRYDEDADLQKAIAESKRIAEEEAKNRRQG